MTGGFSLLGGVSNLTTYNFSTANSRPVALTLPAGANVKSSYTQLTAATTVDIAAFCVETLAGSTSLHNFAYDIAVGSAGNEVVIVSNALQISVSQDYEAIS